MVIKSTILRLIYIMGGVAGGEKSKSLKEIEFRFSGIIEKKGIGHGGLDPPSPKFRLILGDGGSGPP